MSFLGIILIVLGALFSAFFLFVVYAIVRVGSRK